MRAGRPVHGGSSHLLICIGHLALRAQKTDGLLKREERGGGADDILNATLSTLV